MSDISPKRILVVDDDLLILKYHLLSLQRAGYEVTKVGDIKHAIDLLKKQQFDLAILDVVMPPPDEGNFDFADASTAGLHLAALIRRLDQRCKILGFTNSQDQQVFNWFREDPHADILSKTLTTPGRFVEVVDSLLHGRRPKPKVFIVYGHDRRTVLELKDFLQNRLGFPEPIVLAEMKTQGRTIIEKFEEHATNIDIVFVCFTPDDKGKSDADADVGLQPRVRQNVLFELGYFCGKLGRRSGRVILLQRGPIEPASDLGGLVYISIENGIAAASEEIRRELADWI